MTSKMDVEKERERFHAKYPDAPRSLKADGSYGDEYQFAWSAFTTRARLAHEELSALRAEHARLAIDAETREALNVAIHALQHNAEHAKYMMGECQSNGGADLLMPYAQKQGRAAEILERLLSEEA